MKIPFESKLNIKNVNKRNKAFAILNDEEKRREIAYELLNLIVVEKKVEASNSRFWGDSLENINKFAKTSKELQNGFLALPYCEVCAKGGMMLAQIRLGNNVKPVKGISAGYYSEESRMNGSFAAYQGFSRPNWDALEDKYEMSLFYLPYGSNTDEKLVNICCNIIFNGNFSTRDKNDYLKLWEISL